TEPLTREPRRDAGSTTGELFIGQRCRGDRGRIRKVGEGRFGGVFLGPPVEDPDNRPGLSEKVVLDGRSNWKCHAELVERSVSELQRPRPGRSDPLDAREPRLHTPGRLNPLLCKGRMSEPF